MQPLIDHARSFRKQSAERPEEFARLAEGQSPQVLFITCSDSRVVPALITGARPGELFELRTAGNIVPPTPPSSPPARLPPSSTRWKSSGSTTSSSAATPTAVP